MDTSTSGSENLIQGIRAIVFVEIVFVLGLLLCCAGTIFFLVMEPAIAEKFGYGMAASALGLILAVIVETQYAIKPTQKPLRNLFQKGLLFFLTQLLNTFYLSE